MKALVSDIHGNLPALEAVFRDIEARRIEEIVCLGDIVGYGADPEACLDVVMARARWSLLGNHDDALLHGSKGFNPIAAEMIQWTRDRMVADMRSGPDPTPRPDCPRATEDARLPACLTIRHSPASRWEYVERLAPRRLEGDVLYVHGSPLDPVFEYVLPDRFSAWAPDRIGTLLEAVPWLAFCGHTHFPCAIASSLHCHYPQKGPLLLSLDRRQRYIINVGSVGQSRDGDPRACYLLFDEWAHTIEWCRLEYDIAAAAARIEAMCGAGNWCARRLWRGQ